MDTIDVLLLGFFQSSDNNAAYFLDENKHSLITFIVILYYASSSHKEFYVNNKFMTMKHQMTNDCGTRWTVCLRMKRPSSTKEVFSI